MKKKFKYLIEFLKQFGYDKITQSYIFYDSGYDWGLDEMNCKNESGDWKIMKTPSIVRNLLEEILEYYTGEIEDIVNDVNGGDWNRFDVEVEIYPKENRLVYNNATVFYMDGQEEGTEYEFDDEDEDDTVGQKCKEFLKNIGTDEITIQYEGSGDSGYINSYGEKSGGVRVDLPVEIEDICYRELESYYGGWEINEGSHGEIVITEYSLAINHNWFVEVDEYVSLDITITEDTID